ncbi:hypothetical protein [Deinococcus irradiatisoli]|uniref:hypothetical protein n=1 Tax=Deinococcus irradiatisoli TaxID=2202254 RepID=UPI0015E85FAE|nr:hypothetical protein [Deinococcus irradiatisoli]
MNTELSAQVLLIAALAAISGQLTAAVWRGRSRRQPKRRGRAALLAGLVLSAGAGAAAVCAAAIFAPLPLNLAEAGVVGFSVGAVWGPTGLWRLVGGLGLPGVRRPRPGSTTKETLASNPSQKVLD